MGRKTKQVENNERRGTKKCRSSERKTGKML